MYVMYLVIKCGNPAGFLFCVLFILVQYNSNNVTSPHEMAFDTGVLNSYHSDCSSRQHHYEAIITKSELSSLVNRLFPTEQTMKSRVLKGTNMSDGQSNEHSYTTK